MTTYTITVNGKSYEVSVEKKAGTRTTAQPVFAAPSVAPAVAPAATPAPAPTAAAPAAGGASHKILAPMPGKIINVKVNVGDSIQNGQQLLTMEAMKMHNPVLSNVDGVVKEIYVKVGDAVQTGNPLVAIG